MGLRRSHQAFGGRTWIGRRVKRKREPSCIQAVAVAPSYFAFASFPFSSLGIDLAMDIVTSLRANFELLEQAGRRELRAWKKRARGRES